MDLDKVMKTLRSQEAEMTALRHDIHMHPETSYEEFRTSQLVQDKLTEWGIPFEAGLGVTGVVASIRGKRPGNRSIGFRGDMDALNMTEGNSFAHASTIPGKMHGCGHDGHTVMLLYAARYLAENPDFGGTVHCIFQPAEEGGAGAQAMIDDGLFERFPCDAVYSLHNKPGIPVGKFVTRVGPQLAAVDHWVIGLHGTGGHGGSPEKGTDPTVPLAHTILGIHGIISRNVSAQDSAVLSIGMIEAGTANNVIPSDIRIHGTSRIHDPAVQDTIEKRLKDVAEGAAAMSGCTATIDYQRGYPALVNTLAERDKAVAAASALVGAENVDPDNPPINAADDFAFMLLQRPGCNVMMGNGDDPKWTSNHRPDYDFNDEALCHGAAYWISLTDKELNPEADLDRDAA
ncbi:M20 aminoacylase family protein [Psychromarinibacter sp. S121]|uniref:M20 aminoacylase family protein n=1 Tax=Psychromarinibacter sp. S121 TaxID=3415127 RepID=UPI003C7CFF63